MTVNAYKGDNRGRDTKSIARDQMLYAFRRNEQPKKTVSNLIQNVR
jgi:hypothetical protein